MNRVVQEATIERNALNKDDLPRIKEWFFSLLLFD